MPRSQAQRTRFDSFCYDRRESEPRNLDPAERKAFVRQETKGRERVRPGASTQPFRAGMERGMERLVKAPEFDKPEKRRHENMKKHRIQPLRTRTVGVPSARSGGPCAFATSSSGLSPSSAILVLAVRSCGSESSSIARQVRTSPFLVGL